MKQKLIIANWKENPSSLEEANSLLKISGDFSRDGNSNSALQILHAVPYIFAGAIKILKPDSQIILQNISKHTGGSHTGEISVAQASKMGINMSIIGHSETRLSPDNPHGDEDKDVNIKIQNILSANMLVCLCIGEYDREVIDWKNFLKDQVSTALAGVQKENLDKIIFAYEPVWAIGEHAKRAATREEIVESIEYIKTILPSSEGKVLYGGSVDENNAKDILNLEVVDGLLIGRASSDVSKWGRLLNSLH